MILLLVPQSMGQLTGYSISQNALPSMSKAATVPDSKIISSFIDCRALTASLPSQSLYSIEWISAAVPR
jgi:hypothetical protein